MYEQHWWTDSFIYAGPQNGWTPSLMHRLTTWMNSFIHTLAHFTFLNFTWSTRTTVVVVVIDDDDDPTQLTSIHVLTSLWFTPHIVLFILHVSPEDDEVVSAEEDTVAMEVKDSEDGNEALSENAESVSVVSLKPSPPPIPGPATVRWWWWCWWWWWWWWCCCCCCCWW